MKKNQKKIAIVGSGMSGIAAAYFLAKTGYEPEVLESEPYAGGRAQSIWLTDKMIDIGGKNIGRNYPLFRQFVKDMGEHEFEFFGINSTRVREGNMKTIDSSKKIKSIYNFLTTVELSSFAKLLRLALMTKINPDNGYLDSAYFNKLSAKYDHQPITRYFKPKFVENILRTITIRMCGTEPEEYYLGNFRSNVKMIGDQFEQLANGMHYLIKDFQKSCPVKFNTRVTGIIREGNSVTGVLVDSEKGQEKLYYDGVVIATLAVISSEILADEFPQLSDELAKVRYNPVTLAVVRYNRNIFNPTVRAIAFDRTTALSNAGCYGVFDLNIVRYTFSGIKSTESIDENSEPSKVIVLGENSLNKYVNVSKNIRRDYVYKHFKYGLCCYSQYHYRLLERVRKILLAIPGLVVSGDYIRGAAIEACFRAGRDAAEALDKKLSVN